MASSINYITISEAWDYWCCYKKVLRDKNTGVVTVLASRKFEPSPSSLGLLRIGEKISEVNDDEEIIEYTVIALKPNLERMNLQDPLSSARLILYFSLVVLNEGAFKLPVIIKPWANSSTANWTSDTNVSYDDIVEHYIPFDLTPETYVSSTYEKLVNVASGESNSITIGLEHTFDKLLQGQVTGFAVTAEDGYADVFGPECSSFSVRPTFIIEQVVSNKVYNPNITLDTEVAGASKVSGVCRDQNGVILIGERCKVAVLHKDNYRILGAGFSSSANGSFLLNVDCKVGETVVVNFYRYGEDLTGSELMTTVSDRTVGFSPSSSSSSSSMSFSSSSKSSSSESSSSESFSLSSSSSSRAFPFGYFYPEVGGDDGYCKESSYTWDQSLDLVMGRFYETYGIFIRFPSIPIPAGSTILSSYVRLFSRHPQSDTTCNIDCYFNDSDDAMAPASTVISLLNLDLTSAIAWNNLPSWERNTWHETPELKTILQAVIDRPGWNFGQAVMVILQGVATCDQSARREPCSILYDSGSYKPELYIRWEE